MAENESGQDKTEAATPRKRQQAREKGNVPKSQEINTTLILIAGVVAFFLFRRTILWKNRAGDPDLPGAMSYTRSKSRERACDYFGIGISRS